MKIGFHMGRVLCSAAFILLLTSLQAQTPFITTWKTDNPGTSCASCITIPTTGTGYNYAVDWNNDGIFDTSGITGDFTYDFGAPGTYTIQIRGDFPRIFFNHSGDKDKILTVDQWGTGITWSSMDSAFYGCSNLTVPATDEPDLSSVSSTVSMFESAVVFNNSIDHWDVSNIKDMSYMFHLAVAFNQPLNSWIVSSVRSMRGMFVNCTVFDQPLFNWNVSSVTDMSFMFFAARAFNQAI